MTRPIRSACRLLALFAIASALALAGCAPAATDSGGSMTSNSTPKPSDGTRSAKDVFTDFLNTIDDTVQHSGTTFPRWNRQDVAGYNAPACGVKAREDGNQYYTNLEGGPVGDPKAAVETMKSRWEAKGYTIEGAVPWPGENQRIDLSATTPLGTRVVFSPSKGKSGINAKSDCTLDPLARETTTESIPLGGQLLRPLRPDPER